MAVTLSGEFLTIQRNTIRVSEIISCKPVLFVRYDFNGNEIGRDYPKIIVMTNQGALQFLYGTEEERDSDLRDLQEKISSYSASIASRTAAQPTTINISGSSGVNVVSNSNNVDISQETQKEASEIIQNLLTQTKNAAEIAQEVREDIFSALSDFQEQLDQKKEIKRYSFKNLLSITSDISTLNGFVIQLGQVLGFIPR